jgi:hypothetical protein
VHVGKLYLDVRQHQNASVSWFDAMHLLHFGVLKKKTLVHATAVTHSFSFG